jgi:hypothetical protein
MFGHTVAAASLRAPALSAAATQPSPSLQLDLLRLRLLALVQRDRQQAVLVLGVDLLLVDRRGQRGAAEESLITALAQQVVALALLLLLLLIRRGRSSRCSAEIVSVPFSRLRSISSFLKPGRSASTKSPFSPRVHRKNEPRARGVRQRMAANKMPGFNGPNRWRRCGAARRLPPRGLPHPRCADGERRTRQTLRCIDSTMTVPIPQPDPKPPVPVPPPEPIPPVPAPPPPEPTAGPSRDAVGRCFA